MISKERLEEMRKMLVVYHDYSGNEWLERLMREAITELLEERAAMCRLIWQNQLDIASDDGVDWTGWADEGAPSDPYMKG